MDTSQQLEPIISTLFQPQLQDIAEIEGVEEKSLSPQNQSHDEIHNVNSKIAPREDKQQRQVSRRLFG